MGRKRKNQGNELVQAIIEARAEEIRLSTPKEVQKLALKTANLLFMEQELTQRSLGQVLKADELVEKNPTGFGARHLTAQSMAMVSGIAVLSKQIAGILPTEENIEKFHNDVQDEIEKIATSLSPS